MNCQSAQRLLSAERDGVPATRERAALVAHLAECADCRQFRVVIAGAAQAWRDSTATVRAPDALLAWQAVRREIRSDTSSAQSAPWFSRWLLPVAGAAALAIAAVIALPPSSSTSTGATRDVARIKSDETPGGGSSVVYVDDKTGWTVVWAVDDHPKSG